MITKPGGIVECRCPKASSVSPPCWYFASSRTSKAAEEAIAEHLKYAHPMKSPDPKDIH
jgi:hypothetical protein